MCPSRFHLPAPLGSTGISRFIATMGTLTPDPLLPAPGQVSLVHGRALPDLPSPSTPCASAPAMLRFRADLAPDSLVQLSAVLRTSLTVRSLVSRTRPYRVCVAGVNAAHSSTDYLFTSSCSPRRVAGTQ